MPRTIAIGDVHGCSPALDAVLQAIDPRQGDTLVTLGDYVDRGPDSRGVIKQLLAVAKKCRLIPILGNHEEMLLAVIDEQMPADDWLRCGGRATVESYGEAAPGVPALPPEHLSFFAPLRAVLRNRHASLGARQLRSESAAGRAGFDDDPLAELARIDSARPRLGQDGHLGSHADPVGRDSRPRLSEVH